MAFGHVDDLETRGRQQRPRLAPDLLAVLQRTGAMIRAALSA
jgi:hypothetical protein